MRLASYSRPEAPGEGTKEALKEKKGLMGLWPLAHGLLRVDACGRPKGVASGQGSLEGC